MKTLKNVVGAFLMICFLATLAGCEKLDSHGKDGQGNHGHSHD